jgi:hypothetical protein
MEKAKLIYAIKEIIRQKVSMPIAFELLRLMDKLEKE